MNLKRAIAHAEAKGKQEVKSELADRLWETSTKDQRMMNINNLVSGRVKTIKVHWVGIICEVCEVDANFLFNNK